MRIAAFFLACLAASCLAVTAIAENETNQPLPAELQAAVDAYYASIEKGDAKARIKLLDSGMIMMPNHWTMIRGKDKVSEGIRHATEWTFRIRNRKVVDAAASGDVAYTVNAYEYTYRPKDDPPQWHATKNVHIWRRTEGDGWKMRADIWNSDVPLEDFEAENKTMTAEEIAVREAVDSLYIKGLETRDFDLIRKICVPEVVLMSVSSDSSLNTTTLGKWSERFDPDNPPFKSLDSSISSVDISGTAAQVKIHFVVDGDRRVTDYLSMLKIGGVWRVVNIIDY